MTLVTLNTRLGSIPGDRRGRRYNRNPVAFEDRELRLIQGSLGQVIESLDRVDRKGCGQAAVPDVDTG